ncbi:MAG: hypothetical protein ACI4JC_08975 [Faecalibacterium sp.]
MKRTACLLCLVLTFLLFCPPASACFFFPVKVKALILPKFEVDEMSGDFPGEAQYYYEAYCQGGTEYDIRGGQEGSKLYVKDGVALYVTGMGKVNAAASLTALLTDSRFDFSDAYLFSTGCAGSSSDNTVMGDVFLITAAVDYDLGHHADAREMTAAGDATWFHDPSYDGSACKRLDPALTEKAYALIKDIPLRTTENTRAYMAAALPQADWAARDPRVLRGTTVSGDNYWKGAYDHANALKIVQTYGCPDPYATTEMEDLALAVVADRMGMLDRLLILRVSVDLDTFLNGATPERLWNEGESLDLALEESVESADIFATAMENNFRVGRVLIDAILDGTL